MNRTSLLLTAFLALPTVAFAQRGGGGRTEANKHSPLFEKEGMPKGPSIRVRDIEDMSPIKRLLDKRKDLKLTDAQVNQLKDSETKLKQTNEPLLKTVDSLLHEAKTAASGSNDESRAKGREATQGLMSVVRQVQSNYDAAVTEATAAFDAEQQTKVKEILAKLAEDNDNMLKERLGGEGRRG
jgi:hypothetical protein